MIESDGFDHLSSARDFTLWDFKNYIAIMVKERESVQTIQIKNVITKMTAAIAPNASKREHEKSVITSKRTLHGQSPFFPL